MTREIELRAEGALVLNERLLLVEHTRDGSSYWVFPGGHVETGESLTDAVAREFREELSIDVTPGGLLWVHQFIHPGRHTVNFTFRLACDRPDKLKLVPQGRLTGFRWFKPEELRNIELRPPLVDLCAQLCSGNAPTGIPVFRF